MIDEPRRFAVYILADPRIRHSIYDKKSFILALKKILATDSSLKNILAEMKSKGETLSICGKDIFDSSDIQNLIRRNTKAKKKELRTRIKKQRPTLKGGALTREVNRRFKIAVGVSEAKVKKIKQVTLAQALRPVKIGDYIRTGKTVKGYSRAERRDLTKAEKMLIENNINKNPKDIIKIYYDSGLTFRSKTSLRRHIYRTRKKLKI